MFHVSCFMLHVSCFVVVWNRTKCVQLVMCVLGIVVTIVNSDLGEACRIDSFCAPLKGIFNTLLHHFEANNQYIYIIYNVYSCFYYMIHKMAAYTVKINHAKIH